MRKSGFVAMGATGVALAIALSACSKDEATLAQIPKPVSEKSGKNEEKKALAEAELWTCPMHPQIRKTGPGQCPICGMNLVKAERSVAEDKRASSDGITITLPEGHAPFRLSLQRQQLIGVKTGVVQKKPLYKSIEAAGRVAFDPELYTAQNEYLEAIKQEERVRNSPLADVRHSAQRMVESAKLRLKILGLSDSQIAALASKGTSGSNLLVPKPGENLWIYGEVFEMDLPSLQPGMEATISGGSLSGRTLSGKVASVDRVINPATRTAKVRIQVPNARAFLRPEAYVDVTILSPLGEQVTVPFDAILDTGKQAWVFVVREDGTFEPRLVAITHRAGDEVAVEGGLTPGEKIVTSANFLIDSESRLKGALVGTPEQAPAPTPSCPKGEVWHPEMKHCMPKAGQ